MIILKLKQDCVRYVLLKIEKQGFNLTQNSVTDELISNKISNDKFSVEDIRYTLLQLYNGGFLIANPQQAAGYRGLLISDMSWSGHELLDSIRDDKVWHETKKVTSSLASVSIGVIKTIASSVLIGIIKQQTGLNI